MTSTLSIPACAKALPDTDAASTCQWVDHRVDLVCLGERVATERPTRQPAEPKSRKVLLMTTGSCLCGDISFEVGRFSAEIFKCHCSKCRKAFGGASSAVALAPDEAFRWVSGAETWKLFRSPSGYSSCFCSNCGSVLPLHLKSYGLYWIPAGLLDSDPGIVLGRHVHTASKAPWEILDPETERFPEGFEL